MGNREVEIKDPIRKEQRLTNLTMLEFHSSCIDKNINKKSVALSGDSINLVVREELNQENNREEKQKSWEPIQSTQKCHDLFNL